MKKSFTRIIVQNPASLKQSLSTLLINTKPFITSYQSESIEFLIGNLPESSRSIPMNIITDCRIDLVCCLKLFWQMDASKRLREDFKSDLLELEIQLKNAYLIYS